jgi:hypothetical protein
MTIEGECPASERMQVRGSALVAFLKQAHNAYEELRDMSAATIEIRKHLDVLEFAAGEHHANVVRLLNDIRRGGAPSTALMALDSHTARLLGAVEQLAAGAREFERALGEFCGANEPLGRESPLEPAKANK